MISVTSERVKYKRAWAIPSYRDKSPGERLVPHFLERHKPPGTLIDLGAGPGRASLKLKQAGFNVVMLDITADSTDEKVRRHNLPFIEACLWDPLPFKAKFDLFYCTDVMEHLPPERVDVTLDNILGIAQAGFFQIALFEEGFGKYINDRLHLTVMPWDWWADKIMRRWQKCDFDEIEKHRLCAFVA